MKTSLSAKRLTEYDVWCTRRRTTKDGERHTWYELWSNYVSLFASKRRMVRQIDRKNSYYRLDLGLPIPGRARQYHFDTILDGELVLDVFDNGKVSLVLRLNLLAIPVDVRWTIWFRKSCGSYCSTVWLLTGKVWLIDLIPNGWEWAWFSDWPVHATWSDLLCALQYLKEHILKPYQELLKTDRDYAQKQPFRYIS